MVIVSVTDTTLSKLTDILGLHILRGKHFYITLRWPILPVLRLALLLPFVSAQEITGWSIKIVQMKDIKRGKK